MGEDETRVQAAEGHTQLGILAQTEKKEGSITYPLLTQPSRGQVVNYVPFLGLRVCHTDLERKEKTHRESKPVFLESLRGQLNAREWGPWRVPPCCVHRACS